MSPGDKWLYRSGYIIIIISMRNIAKTMGDKWLMFGMDEKLKVLIILKTKSCWEIIVL